MQKATQFEKDVEIAKRCLYDCPFRESFDVYMGGRMKSLRDIIDDPKTSDINDISFVRGALAQLTDISKVPHYILQLEERIRANQNIQAKKRVAGKAKKKEITA